MPMGQEPERLGSPLQTTREPQGPVKPGGKGSMGEQACNDALLMIGACWLLFFILVFSLRRHTV
jgi:hypothetical protein